MSNATERPEDNTENIRSTSRQRDLRIKFNYYKLMEIRKRQIEMTKGRTRILQT